MSSTQKRSILQKDSELAGRTISGQLIGKGYRGKMVHACKTRRRADYFDHGDNQASQRSASRWLKVIFIAFFIFSQFYYGYRYPLQYNSVATSPTYSDTPRVLQVAKYCVALAATYACVLILFGRRQVPVALTRTSRSLMKLFAGFLVYSGMVSVSILLRHGSAIENVFFVKMFFFIPIVLLIPLIHDNWISTDWYVRLVWFSFAYHAIYSVVQLVNYFLFSRLPALAYEEGIVRFGGGWDDPNGFGVFMVIPLLLLCGRHFVEKKIIRYPALMLSLLLLCLTVSFSAALAVWCALVCFAWLTRNTRLVSVMLVVLAMVAGTLWVEEDLSLAISGIYEQKRGSVQAHLSQASWRAVEEFAAEASFPEILFGRHDEVAFNECFYLMFAFSHGLIGLVLLVVVIGLALLLGFAKTLEARRFGDLRRSEFLAVLTSFIIGFSMASAIIPYFSVFPVNLWFWTSTMLTWLMPVRETRDPARRSNYV